jgi:hypothetical protein
MIPRVFQQRGFRMGRIALALFVFTGIVGTTEAAEVSREITVDAKAADVWRAIGPYCEIADWYPGIETCTEENINGALNRRLGTADGAEFLEKQLERNDQTMSYSYAIIEGPLPVLDYRATLSVTESVGKTVVIWSSTFEPNGVSEEEATSIVGGVYDTGLEAVKQRFAN